ncbi:MAG TPA: nitroreductase family protein [Burkholderiales bacterium]|nr:nitroreductase family protein [Burkholderiales bacterium]
MQAERPEGMNVDATMEKLLTRHSVGAKHLVQPGPGEEQLWLAALAALRAPDHEKLVPFRFLVIDQAQRARLADLYADLARREGKSSEEIEIERDRALRAPALIAMLVRIDPAHPIVPAEEQWIAAGGALSNFVMALHFMGYGAKVVSGRKARDPAIVDAFCGPGETLVGWIAAGTPDRKVHPRYKDNPDSVLSRWTPRA